MSNEDILVIKAKGDDGYKTFSVRLSEDILNSLDELSAKTGHSRNALISELLKYGLEHCKIEY